jgi:predicted Zn-dependent peptidase
VLAILSVIFSGSLSSRLFQRIRETLGLAYSVGSFNSSNHDSGILSTSNHQNVEKLLTNLKNN